MSCLGCVKGFLGRDSQDLSIYEKRNLKMMKFCVCSEILCLQGYLERKLDKQLLVGRENICLQTSHSNFVIFFFKDVRSL